MSAAAPPADAPDGSPPAVTSSSSSQAGQASAAARDGAVSHWSKVHLGVGFTFTVENLGQKKDQSITVNLRRHPTTGFSESLEPDWVWKPDKARADSARMLKQSLLGAAGSVLVKERLSGKKVAKQGKLFFGKPPPKPAQPAPPAPPAAAQPAPPAEPEVEQDRDYQAAAARAAAAAAAVQTVQVCGGLSLVALAADNEMEPLGQPFVQHYPFAYHSETTPWSLPSYDGMVWSRECFARGRLLPPGDPADAVEGPCPSCSKLTSNDTLIKLLQRATSPDTVKAPLNDRFLSHKQLCDKYRAKGARWQLLRVKFWHQRDRIKKLAAPMEAAKQIFVLLARNDLPRVREFMSRMLARGASPKMMLSQLGKAIDGKYTPRSDVTEDDLDKAEHALILGGPKMLWGLQRTEGFVSKRTVMTARERPRFITSWDDTVHASTVSANLDRFALAEKPRYEKAIFHLMLDDVALEPRRRMSPNDSYIRGYARESNLDGVLLAITSEADLDALVLHEKEKGMGVGGLRLSEELTVFALGANHEIDYQISLVAASGTAKKGAKALHMQPMLETVLTEWRRKGQDSRGRVVDIVKDGASIMNAAVFPLVTTCTIDRSSAVGKHLFGPDSKGMLLFYDRCGNPDDDEDGDYGDRDGRKRKSSWPLVDSCDDKHFLKRFRQALGRSEGVRIKDWAFNKLLLSRLLVEVGNDETKVRTMFGDGQEDSQNVAAAVQLLLAISSFRSKSAADFSDSRTSSPTFQPMLRELKILAEYCATEFEVVMMQSADKPGTFLTLSALNQSFSKLAHMAFALFRENGSKFVPPQHYYNTQITMRAKYVSQAVSKAEGIEQYFSYQDADDREEGMFGMVRVLEAGANFDIVQFEDRASELMSLDRIYARHPDWRKGSRRLSGPMFDHVNPKSIIAASGRDPVLLSKVNLSTCWLLGGADAKQALTADNVFAAPSVDWSAIAKERHGEDNDKVPDMLRPRGVYVGIEVHEEEAPTPRAARDDAEEWESWLDLEDLIEEEEQEEQEEEPASDLGAAAPGASGRRKRLKIDFEGYSNGVTADKGVRLKWGSKKGRQSSERIHRVRGQSKAGTSGEAEEAVTGEIVAGITPLIATLDSPEGVTLVVVLPMKFDVSNQKGVDTIAVDELGEATTTAYVQIMKPSSLSVLGATSDEATIRDVLIFKDTVMAAKPIALPGKLLQSCNPDLVCDASGGVAWHFGVFTLDVVLTCSWPDVDKSYRRHTAAHDVAKSVLPALEASLLYRRSKGQALFIAEGTESADPDAPQAGKGKGKAPVATEQATVTCELCGQAWAVKEMRHHLGAHLLESEAEWQRKYKKPKPSFGCMLCGVRECMGEPLVDPSSFAGCTVSLVSGSSSSVKKPRHQCKLIGTGLDYSLGSAANSVLSAPCTNRPVKCTKCALVVSSYSMADHFDAKHGGRDKMDDTLRGLVQLAPHEESHVKQLLDMRLGQVKRAACTDDQCTFGGCVAARKKKKT